MKFAWVIVALCSVPVWAADGVDTISIIKQQGRQVTLIEIEDMKSGKAVYQVQICGDGCDLWEAPTDSLRALTDYAYLYALYKGNYTDNSRPAGKDAQGRTLFHPLPMVEQDATNGYGHRLLQQYSAEYDCGKADNPVCVLDNIFTAHKLRAYGVAYDEGAAVTSASIAGPDSPHDVPYGGQP
jgi:hypothetical protein